MARETRPRSSAALRELEARFQDLGVQVARPEATWSYVRQHKDLPDLLTEAARAVRNELPDVPLALELVPDPEVEDAEGDTLVLYLRPKKVTSKLFVQLEGWNKLVAHRTAHSKAWFIVNLDLRKEP